VVVTASRSGRSKVVAGDEPRARLCSGTIPDRVFKRRILLVRIDLVRDCVWREGVVSWRAVIFTERLVTTPRALVLGEDVGPIALLEGGKQKTLRCPRPRFVSDFGSPMRMGGDSPQPH